MVDSYYFVKYLPVDGEITDNSSVIFKINGRWTGVCSFDDMLGSGIQDVKQVKLFLCGRSVVIGDSVIVPYPSNLEVGVTESNLEYINDLCGISFGTVSDSGIYLGAFKVIGELSSDCYSYVGEGDEFGEDMVGLRLTDMHGRFRAGGRVYLLGDSINMDYCRVVIKGPCGHFH